MCVARRLHAWIRDSLIVSYELGDLAVPQGAVILHTIFPAHPIQVKFGVESNKQSTASQQIVHHMATKIVTEIAAIVRIL
jgi:hypothetical protein